VVSSDCIVTDNPKIEEGGWSSVPPTQHIGRCQFGEEGGVGVDALAFKDRGGAFRERDIRGVKVARPRSGEYRGRVHAANPTPPLSGLEPDSPERRLLRVVFRLDPAILPAMSYLDGSFCCIEAHHPHGLGAGEECGVLDP
jgi:hypothetical protein